MNNSSNNIFKKIISIIGIFTLVLISAISFVSALGIAPSQKILDYTTQEQTFNARIINSESQDSKFQLTIEGELKEYIELEDEIIDIRSDESEKSFSYKVLLPAGISPGVKTGKIIITKINSNSQQNSVGGSISLVHQIQVNIPYNGLFAKGFLSISEVEKNSPIQITLSVQNIGTETINEAYGKIIIKSQEVIHENITQKINNLKSKESQKIDYAWTPNNNIKNGEYTLQYTLYYDGKSEFYEKTITLGEYNIEIINASVGNFVLGAIAKIEISTENLWNNPIDSKTTVNILDNESNIIRTSDVALQKISKESNTVTTYLDTQGLEEGEYTFQIIMTYGSKITEKNYQSNIKSNKIELFENEIIKEEKNKYSIHYILGFAVSILLLIVAIRTIYRKHK